MTFDISKKATDELIRYFNYFEEKKYQNQMRLNNILNDYKISKETVLEIDRLSKNVLSEKTNFSDKIFKNRYIYIIYNISLFLLTLIITTFFIPVDATLKLVSTVFNIRKNKVINFFQYLYEYNYQLANISLEKINRFVFSNNILGDLLVSTENRPKKFNFKVGYQDGVCAGASLFFNLVLSNNIDKFEEKKTTLLASSKSFKKVNNLEELLKKTSSLFSFGALDAAVLLQKLRIYSPIDCYNNFPGLVPFFKQHGFKENLLVKNFNESFSALKKGTYNVFFLLKNDTFFKSQTDGHIISIIKVSNELVYIFDINIGLIKMEGFDVSNKVLSFIKENYNRNLKYIKFQRFDFLGLESKLNQISFFAKKLFDLFFHNLQI